VGHYWLRAPELAPTDGIRKVIELALEQVKDFAARVHAGHVAPRHSHHFTDLLVIGIGGSALGPQLAADALGDPENDRMRPHFFDNTDPDGMQRELQRLAGRLDRTLTVVISKSGGTVETAAQMLIAHEWLQKALGKDEARARMVAITDPKSGTLRELASAQGWATLPIPSNVGGRFCALTAVGLLPAHLCGLRTQELLSGAAAMAERCRAPRATDNPAAMIAMLSWLHDCERGHSVHVMMPYSDRLKSFAAWYVQLWAESLGKRVDRAGRTVECGPTPLPAVGATDQHAQVQLFMEGPRNKLVTFVGVTSHERDLTVPASEGANAYLGGRTLAPLLEA